MNKNDIYTDDKKENTIKFTKSTSNEKFTEKFIDKIERVKSNDKNS